MAGTLQILIVGPDPKLHDECETALAALAHRQLATQYVPDFRSAAEAAKSRRPVIAIAEMGVDLHPLKTLADDLAVVSPETLVVGAFRPELFGHEASESAVLIEALRSGVRDFCAARCRLSICRS